MNFLLDTHALIWLISDADQLSESAVEAIQEGTIVYASHVSLWEMAVKSRLGKLTIKGAQYEDGGVGVWFAKNIPKAKLTELPIVARHLGAVEFLPDHHRDPFDRLLVAQAQIESLTFITSDELIRSYDVTTLW